MTRVYLSCSNSFGCFPESLIAEVGNLLEARDYAKALARSPLYPAGREDWKRCSVHVRNDEGEELFIMPVLWAQDSMDFRNI
jgi:hypothetical protein